MKALIAGAGGQVGQALVAAAPAGVEAVACARDELDIADPASARRAIERVAPAVLVNAAGYTAVDRAEAEPEQAFRANGSGVANLAAICAERGIRLVHLSTDFVFDGNRSRPYRPGDPTGPLGVYGKSKLAGETATLSGPGNLVIRTAWVYAAGGVNFVGTMLRLMRERDEVRVVADQVGTPTHARSLAGAIWSLVETGATGIRHFTDAGIASWYDFAVAIHEEARGAGLLDREIPILPIATAEYPTPAVRPAYSVLDKSETWRLLGAPARHWRVELREMIAAQKALAG
jgi:dTDP-4-dehydrorhamnose reductase